MFYPLVIGYLPTKFEQNQTINGWIVIFGVSRPLQPSWGLSSKRLMDQVLTGNHYYLSACKMWAKWDHQWQIYPFWILKAIAAFAWPYEIYTVRVLSTEQETPVYKQNLLDVVMWCSFSSNQNHFIQCYITRTSLPKYLDAEKWWLMSQRA